jgi:plasmid stabilization system protein ParE
MISRVIVRSAAEADLCEAYDWYQQREPELGAAFVREVDSCMKNIVLHPEMYPTVHNDVRQGLVRRFPYCVLYLIADDAIIVLSVFHAARDPKIWKRRV